MVGQCTYCNSLHKAIAGQNFCSNKGDNIDDVSTNAYYFNTNKLSSGEHVSRFSIRTISDGYQKHVLKNREFVLDKNRYLLINEGEEFTSELQTNNPIEGLLIAFNKSDYNSLVKNFTHSHKELIDDPFETDDASIPFDVQDFGMNLNMQLYFHKLKEEILYGEEQSIYYEELFNKILSEIYVKQNSLQNDIHNLKAEKNSTKKEIFKRIELCRNYMDNHFSENISLNDLALKSTMSPYHLQRCFKAFYKVSPHQYLISRRIEKAKFLLKDTAMTVGGITKNIGFSCQSSFGRLFKKQIGTSPKTYRIGFK